MHDDFSNLFRYNDWANNLVFDSFSALATPIPRAHALLTHLTMAQKVWLDRIHSRDNRQSFWSEIPIDELRNLSGEITVKWQEFVSRLTQSDYERNIQYVNTKGLHFQSTISNIMRHVINHSTHHRGQIVLLLRQNGYEPPVTDYIVFVRE